jgi:hypothetical protein
MRISIFLILFVAYATACDQPSPVLLTCGEPGTAQGVNLTILDSITGAQFPFSDLYATAVEGAYRDSLAVSAITSIPTHPYWLASDREGTYTVTVQASGYLPWTKRGVVVSRVECKIVPAVLTAKLQRVQ